MKKTPLIWPNPTDGLRTSDEWENVEHIIKTELYELGDKKIFGKKKNDNIAQTYLKYAEQLLEEKGLLTSDIQSLIRELKERVKDPDTWSVFIQTLRLATITARAGTIPKLAQAGAEMKTNSSKTRELKKKIIHHAVERIFKKNPQMKKTLGHVWNKFDVVNKSFSFMDVETRKEYTVKTGLDEKGKDVVFISGDGGEKFSPYAKKSLQRFINDLK
ncbi:hypothetical protein ACFL4N_03910 [Thermodesulfobacteriota bacterium]